MIRRIAVIIPARQEERLIGACLDSVAASFLPGIHARIIVVADSCTDGTAAVARSRGATVLEIDAGNVGSARRLGVEFALRTGVDGLWLAHTDADSIVPANWLSEQIHLANSGADVVVGTVRPDVNDLSDDQATAWLATRIPGQPNGHVHGANLGIRADRYVEVGGFAEIAEHEDVALVEACRARGARIVATDANDVLTSGRADGRTPGGYARYLHTDLIA